MMYYKNVKPKKNEIFFLQKLVGNKNLINFDRAIEYETIQVNVLKTEKSYLIEMVVPGIQKEQIKVESERGILTVSYDHKENQEVNAESYLRFEFRPCSFHRSFQIPDDADSAQIEARYENGIIVIEVPKKQTAAHTGKKVVAVA